MAASASDLCLAATVAADLGIASDATVERCVTAASKAIARHCGRTFERSASLTEYVESFGTRFLLLDRPPILSIASVVEFGSTVDPDDYQSIGKNADGGLVFHLTRTWRSTQYDTVGAVVAIPAGSSPQSGDGGITVVYSGGYVTPGQKAIDSALTVTVPEDLQEAAAIVATALYRRRGLDQNIAAESLGDWSVSYRAALPMLVSPEVEALVAPYHLVRVS